MFRLIIRLALSIEGWYWKAESGGETPFELCCVWIWGSERRGTRCWGNAKYAYHVVVLRGRWRSSREKTYGRGSGGMTIRSCTIYWSFFLPLFWEGWMMGYVGGCRHEEHCILCLWWLKNINYLDPESFFFFHCDVSVTFCDQWMTLWHRWRRPSKNRGGGGCKRNYYLPSKLS